MGISSQVAGHRQRGGRSARSIARSQEHARQVGPFYWGGRDRRVRLEGTWVGGATGGWDGLVGHGWEPARVTIRSPDAMSIGPFVGVAA
jgi:hypothetical protein